MRFQGLCNCLDVEMALMEQTITLDRDYSNLMALWQAPALLQLIGESGASEELLIGP